MSFLSKTSSLFKYGAIGSAVGGVLLMGGSAIVAIWAGPLAAPPFLVGADMFLIGLGLAGVSGIASWGDNKIRNRNSHKYGNYGTYNTFTPNMQPANVQPGYGRDVKSTDYSMMIENEKPMPYDMPAGRSPSPVVPTPASQVPLPPAQVLPTPSTLTPATPSVQPEQPAPRRERSETRTPDPEAFARQAKLMKPRDKDEGKDRGRTDR